VLLLKRRVESAAGRRSIMVKALFSGWLRNNYSTFYAGNLFSIVAALIPARGLTQVGATPPYSVTTFATAPRGLSAPDSVTFSATNVFIGYRNGGAPDGSSGAMSNVVEHDFKGNLIDNFTVVGHNDGLRYNPRTNTLWALQNEDGNANLSIINLQTGHQEIFPASSYSTMSSQRSSVLFHHRESLPPAKSGLIHAYRRNRLGESHYRRSSLSSGLQASIIYLFEWWNIPTSVILRTLRKLAQFQVPGSTFLCRLAGGLIPRTAPPAGPPRGIFDYQHSAERSGPDLSNLLCASDVSDL
jgi:hypothetical protein